MATKRVELNEDEDSQGYNGIKNNEVILDEELLMHDMWLDPVAAIPAIVYSKKNSIGKMYAKKVRDDLCDHFGCTLNGGGLIPLVGIDDEGQLPPAGPFVAHDEVSSIAI